MRRRLTLLFLLLTAATAVAQSGTRCAWLTLGSAEAVLGTPVSVNAKADSNWAGECHFARETSAIHIYVGKTIPQMCPKGSTALTGMGNEAWQCTLTGMHGEPMETITGRVRETWFEVSVVGVKDVTRMQDPKERYKEPFPASLLQRLAELVAGNLY